MRLLPIWIAAIAVALPMSVFAQSEEQAQSGRRIAFDTTVDIEDGAAALDDITADRLPTCVRDIASRAGSRRPLYDENGVLVAASTPATSPAPAATCAPSGSGQGARFDGGTPRPQPAQNTACATQSDILISGASGRPRYDANGALIRAPAATCAPPPAAVQRVAEAPRDRVIVENESSGGCIEDRLTGTRTCRSSGSITIGNSAEGNERTRQMVDDLLDDLGQD